eukprot:gene5307-5542_t
MSQANRRRWRPLVQHCRQQPGVDQQIERSGVSARLHIGTSHQQHAAALAAVGLQPEYDAFNDWHGFRADLQDPLDPPPGASEHPLASAEWREVTAAEYFERVVAQDGSAEQLKHAALRPNIEYQEADAHSSGLPAACADLVTVAQALHWFDHPRFYREARRILRPHTGVLAAWTYRLPVLNAPDHPAQKLLLHLYEEVLGPWWDPRRRLVDQGYRGIEPSDSSDFDTVTRHELESTKTQTLDQVLGWLHSWSAYHTYLKEQPDKPDPLVQFRQDLLRACGEQATGETEVTFTLPFDLIVAKGPKEVLM